MGKSPNEQPFLGALATTGKIDLSANYMATPYMIDMNTD